MSSEPEESAEHPDEPNANSDVNVDQSLDEKGNGPREHAKPRRRRRGKKRKQKKESAATCEAENPEECESELHAESEHGDCDSPEWGSDENLSCYYDTLTDVIIRPVNVPKAPLNSTQFIMDDHDDCRFYMSFETPNPYGDTDSHLDREAGDIIEPIREDAAYIDIDYQYESPQDFDNSAYYDKEFELSYKNNRFEELMRLSRADLIKKLQSLESRLKELSEDLVKENPSPVLEKLQAELLELQEKNSYLKECNTKLTSVLLQNEADCAETVTCQALAGVSVSSISHDEHESEDSEREVYEQCSESVNEVVMSDTVNDTCNKSCEVEMDDNEVKDYRQIGHNEEDSNQLTNYNVEHNDQPVDHNEDTDQLIDHREEATDQKVDHNENSDQMIDHIEEDTDQQVDHNQDTRELIECNVTADDGKLLLKKLEAGEPSSSCTTVINCEDKKSKHIHSNSHVMHCQPNSHVNDDLRTLNIISSELFHNANQTKCSSSVPLDGGMSPSETSVN